MEKQEAEERRGEGREREVEMEKGKNIFLSLSVFPRNAIIFTESPGVLQENLANSNIPSTCSA